MSSAPRSTQLSGSSVVDVRTSVLELQHELFALGFVTPMEL
jgi:hypothetical protein